MSHKTEEIFLFCSEENFKESQRNTFSQERLEEFQQSQDFEYGTQRGQNIGNDLFECTEETLSSENLEVRRDSKYGGLSNSYEIKLDILKEMFKDFDYDVLKSILIEQANGDLDQAISMVQQIKSESNQEAGSQRISIDFENIQLRPSDYWKIYQQTNLNNSDQNNDQNGGVFLLDFEEDEKEELKVPYKCIEQDKLEEDAQEEKVLQYKCKEQDNIEKEEQREREKDQYKNRLAYSIADEDLETRMARKLLQQQKRKQDNYIIELVKNKFNFFSSNQQQKTKLNQQPRVSQIPQYSSSLPVNPYLQEDDEPAEQLDSSPIFVNSPEHFSKFDYPQPCEIRLSTMEIDSSSGYIRNQPEVDFLTDGEKENFQSNFQKQTETMRERFNEFISKIKEESPQKSEGDKAEQLAQQLKEKKEIATQLVKQGSQQAVEAFKNFGNKFKQLF